MPARAWGFKSPLRHVPYGHLRPRGLQRFGCPGHSARKANFFVEAAPELRLTHAQQTDEATQLLDDLTDFRRGGDRVDRLSCRRVDDGLGPPPLGFDL